MIKNFSTHKKFGFTMAEAVLAIGIIGVLAAISMPTLINTYRRIVLENAEKKEAATLSQAMTMLSLRSPRLRYATTQAFVEELQEYLKINKICNSNNIKNCWPTEKIELQDNSSYAIANAKTNNVFLMNNVDPDGNTADYANDNVAFITHNGMHVLINFNRNCNPNEGDMNRSCYVALVDLNGEKCPNKVGEDIKVINARGFIVPYNNSEETAGIAGARTF